MLSSIGMPIGAPLLDARGRCHANLRQRFCNAEVTHADLTATGFAATELQPLCML